MWGSSPEEEATGPAWQRSWGDGPGIVPVSLPDWSVRAVGWRESQTCVCPLHPTARRALSTSFPEQFFAFGKE